MRPTISLISKIGAAVAAGALIVFAATVAAVLLESEIPTPTPRPTRTPSPIEATCVPLPDFTAGITGTPSPSPTAIDLYPDRPRAQKTEVIVFHCSGESIGYLIGSSADLTTLPLEEGDQVLILPTPGTPTPTPWPNRSWH